jgi:hypothetical protein
MSDSGFSGPTKLVLGLLLIAIGLAFAAWYATSKEAPKLGDKTLEQSVEAAMESPAPATAAPASQDRPTSAVGAARASAAKAQKAIDEHYQKALDTVKGIDPTP